MKTKLGAIALMTTALALVAGTAGAQDAPASRPAKPKGEADDPQSAKGQAKTKRQVFDVFPGDQPGGKPVGTLTLERRPGKKAGTIVTTRVVKLNLKGKALTIRSSSRYEMTDKGPKYMNGTGSTGFNGKEVLVADLSLSPDQSQWSALGTLDRSALTGKPEEKSKLSKEGSLPKEPMISSGDMPLLAPLLVTKAGQTREVTSAEFPDDIDELVNVKKRWTLKREASGKDGTFKIGFYRPKSKSPASVYTYDKAGTIIELELYGKFRCKPKG